MAVGRRRKANPYQHESRAIRERIKAAKQRKLQCELLEDRRLMAVGPTLINVLPNSGIPINNNDVLKVGPRELLFRFSEGQQIDPATIATGIGIRRAGFDATFGNANDVVIRPGFAGLSDRPNDVIVRFADPLPDDLYQVTIVGTGTAPLKNISGDVFNGGADQVLSFRLDLPPEVVAVVPQPITRGTNGVLSQEQNVILVYFNGDRLNTASAQNPGLYKVVNQSTGEILQPTSVTYTVDATDPTRNVARLVFASLPPVGNGIYQLQLGASDESNETLVSAINVGSMGLLGFTDTRIGYIGDNTALTPLSSDVDLYRYQIVGGTTIDISLANIATPAQGGAPLDLVLRLFDSTGTVITTVDAVTGAGSETLTRAVPAGVYYVGVSAKGNSAYNPVTGAGRVAGSGVGSYQLQFTQSGITSSDENSSFASATPVGTLGRGQTSIAGVITPQFNDIAFPGTSDDPGHRRPIAGPDGTRAPESHLYGPADTTPGIPTIDYNFQDVIGTDPNGNTLFNAITENQKQRAREVFEIYSRYAGVRFVETPASGLLVATGDLRAIDPAAQSGPGGAAGLFGNGKAIMDAAENWGDSEYGGEWFETAMHEIGHGLGLGHAYDLPSVTVQGRSDNGIGGPGEPVFPGDADILHIQTLFRPDSNDIDLYKFDVANAGKFRAEILAERLSNPSSLDAVLTLYREINGPSGPTRELVSRNDNYYSNDPFIELDLEPGTYYIAVTAHGMTGIDPSIVNSGFGGTSQGSYQLRLSSLSAPPSSIVDQTGNALDGDGKGLPGGIYTFSFVANAAANTIYVDKSAAGAGLNGTIARPFNNLATAISAAESNTAIQAIRIVGNGGADRDLATAADNLPYLIGRSDAGLPLPDGIDFRVPKGVVAQFDAGALVKLRRANIDAGTTAVNVDRSGAAIQVLGTPQQKVLFTSYANDTLGGDSDGPTIGVRPGDWGGIVFRDDSDYENLAASPETDSPHIFVNYVNNADITFGGGRVNVESIESVYTPVHMVKARPTISFNTITRSADAAISADPDSFDDSFGRIGPEVHGNVTVNNSINGLFVRIRTQFGSPVDVLTVQARFDDTDITHIITENLVIQGTPGGFVSDGTTTSARLDARLRIDPGVVVKFEGSRVETRIGGQLIAEGTPDLPIVLTALKDDRYGAQNGTFDTTSDGGASQPPNSATGQWGGLFFAIDAIGSIDYARVFYGGATIPIEGGFDAFNALEIHQADVRVSNSLFQFNAGGQSQSSRNGRGNNANTTIFVRGAQPILIDNIIRDNAGAVVSTNANALQAVVLNDYGRSTGRNNRKSTSDGNFGPLVRNNRIQNNGTNGMEVRGARLTTETVWDDTDIAHVVRNEIAIPNHHTFGGLRIQSSVSESLVVKLLGANAGLTATGTPLDISDRIGGSLYVLGQPGRPVVFTSLRDDTVAAGFNVAGIPLFDTNNDGASTGTAGDWRSLKLDKYSNDRNVAIGNETELPLLAGVDTNAIPRDAQFLGNLAPNEKAGDDARRLGFELHGAIAFNNPRDVDVYSFTADPGKEVWIDIDRTSYGLDSMLELVDANGSVLLRALGNDKTSFSGPLSGAAQNMNKDPFNGRDFFTTNPFDPSFRVVLPGTTNASTYFVRVRSQPRAGQENQLDQGLSSGEYQLQVRVRQADEKPGSTIRMADIRFPTNGIEVLGLPIHSPLLGESLESSANNDTFANAQNLGNLLTSDRNTLSVGGNLSSATDVDWFRFDLNFDLIQSIAGVSDAFRTWSTIFDIDYADGISRPDTSLYVFDQTGRLIFQGRDSDIADDQPAVGQGANTTDLSRGSFGKNDAYIGAAQLPAGIVGGATRTYFVAVTSNRVVPEVLNATFNSTANQSRIRLEPVDSVRRILEDHFESSQFDNSAGTATPAEVRRAINVNSTQALNTAVVPFKIEDVPVYTTTLTDVASGTLRTGINRVSRDINRLYGDIAFRSDGVLYGYEGVDPTVQNVNGRLVTLNTSTGAMVVVGNDAIPDIGATPAIEQNSTVRVDALAYAGDPTTTPPSLAAFYSVPDSRSGFAFSRLYRANPLSGTANDANNGFFYVTDLNGRTLGSALASFNGGATNLQITAAVTGANSFVFTFDGADFGAPGAPQVTRVGDNITVRINQFSRAASVDSTFGSPTTIRFSAKTPGAEGNQINIRFERALLGAGRGPEIVSSGNGVAITLNATPGSETTASDLVNTINSSTDPNLRISAQIVAGPATTNLGALVTSPITLSLSGGVSPNSVTDIVNAINTSVIGGFVRLNAFGDTSSPVAFGTPVGSIPLVGGGASIGRTTGMAFQGARSSFGNLFGVSNTGDFYRIGFSGVSNAVRIPGSPQFAALSPAPQNVQGGAFSQLLFAYATDGRVYALNSVGSLQNIFDTNNDGVPDSPSFDSGFTGATGFAFSPADFNLWHPTFQRQFQDHGVNEAPDFSRDARKGGQSFQFGYEEFNLTPGEGSSTYQPFAGGVAPFGVSDVDGYRILSSRPDIGNNYNVPGGAKGRLETNSFDLTTYSPSDKPTLYFNYFLDTQNRNSTLLANEMQDSARVYVITTDANGVETRRLVATNNSVLDDPGTGIREGELPPSITVSSREAGATSSGQPLNRFQRVQELFDSTGVWRQARVDLSEFAGAKSVRLRFDFSTYGTMFQGIEGDEYSSGRDARANGLSDNNFEGFYVDDIIVGATERGEMVTGTTPNTNFITTPAPISDNPTRPTPTQTLVGPYQLEIRRGTQYGFNPSGAERDIRLFQSFDTNERLIPDSRVEAPISDITFDTGLFNEANFTRFPSGSAKPWVINQTTSTTGASSAKAGVIGDNERSSLELQVQTGAGSIFFDRRVSSEQGGDFLSFSLDGQVLGTWSGEQPWQTVVVTVGAGVHRLAWTYTKNGSVSQGLDTAFIDNIRLPSTQRGVVSRLDFRGEAIGDQNTLRQQGHIQVEQNAIYNAAQIGIRVSDDARETTDGSRTFPGAVRNLTTLNNSGQFPGVTIANNVVAFSGQVGIQYGGDPNPANQTIAGVPFGRIVNNTVFGLTVTPTTGDPAPSGVGIDIRNNASPTILNNIVANTATGIAIDASSQNDGVIIGANLFSGNTANGPLGTNPIVLAAGAPLFVNPDRRNFYLRAGSSAIDSSLNSLADRPSLVAVKSPLGIPESPILAPDRDELGQLRVDDPSQAPPPGLGVNIFKDRGAVERADFVGPTAIIFDPLDNDTNGKDEDNRANFVAIDSTTVSRFVIKFSDSGTGIDDALVTSDRFRVTQDGNLLTLGTDYLFVYDANADEAIFIPVAGFWNYQSTFVITVDNSDATGIKDLAANNLQSNQSDGSTVFTIFVGARLDFGDAPDPTYPTLLASNGARHKIIPGYFLGLGSSQDTNGKQSADASGDDFDDGITNIGIFPGLNVDSTFNYVASGPGILDVWVDLNRDGDWADAGEKVWSFAITASTLSGKSPGVKIPATTSLGPSFARFRFSSAGTSAPTGAAPDGEVEDYRVNLRGSPFQNPNNRLDVNNDGFVSPIDALIVINYINRFGGGPIPSGEGPPFYDVNGDGTISPTDVLLVVDFLNGRSGQPEADEADAVSIAAAAPLTTETSSAATAAFVSTALVYETKNSPKPSETKTASAVEALFSSTIPAELIGPTQVSPVSADVLPASVADEDIEFVAADVTRSKKSDPDSDVDDVFAQFA